MESYQITLQDKKEIASDTMAFYFSKPNGFNFTAGQYNDWKIPSVPKSKVETGIRSFSIAAAPYENFLMLATRIRVKSAFKETLKDLPLGTKIEITGPLGDFVLPSSPQLTQLTKLTSFPFVFLAGGIGITPFRSMTLQASHDNDPRQIYLFSINRHPEDAAFLEELKDLKNPNFHFVPVMTQEENWPGERGHVDSVMLLKYLKNLKSPIYFVTGPPEMVKSLRQVLEGLGIADDHLRTEEFSGY